MERIEPPGTGGSVGPWRTMTGCGVPSGLVSEGTMNIFTRDRVATLLVALAVFV